MYTVTPERINVKSTGLNANENSNNITQEEWNSLLNSLRNIDAVRNEQIKSSNRFTELQIGLYMRF